MQKTLTRKTLLGEHILNATLLTWAYFEIHRAEESGRGKKWAETAGESYVFSFDF